MRTKTGWLRLNKKNQTLLIDTSTSWLLYALWSNKDGEDMKVNIERNSLKRDDFIHRIFYSTNPSKVVLGSGPGSLTGLKNLYTYFSVIRELKNTPIYEIPSLNIWKSLLDPENKFQSIIIPGNRKLAFKLVDGEKFIVIEKEQNPKEELLFDPGGYWIEPAAIPKNDWNKVPLASIFESNMRQLNGDFKPDYGHQLHLKKQKL